MCVNRYTGTQVDRYASVFTCLPVHLFVCLLLLTACAPASTPHPSTTATPTPAGIKPAPTTTPTHAGVKPAPTTTPTPAGVKPAPTATPTHAGVKPAPTASLVPAGFTPAPPTPIAGAALYETQPGDTLNAVAARFGVPLDEIYCTAPYASELLAACPHIDTRGVVSPTWPLPGSRLLPPGQTLVVPDVLGAVGPSARLLPDSEIVFSTAALDFDTAAYLESAGGYLHTHEQWLSITSWTSGADILDRVALENTLNPRLLLALLEYQCGCVLGNPGPLAEIEPFFGILPWDSRTDLYGQLFWAATTLWEGYSGWRTGTLTTLKWPDGTATRLPPTLNAGTAAILYFFAQLYEGEAWLQAIDPQQGFPALYTQMFGDPWARAVEIFPPDMAEPPPLILPFEPYAVWSFSGGPHVAWEGAGPDAALDFAPASAASGCVESNAWVVAMADGLVVRAEFGGVMQDLDGDGLEQTGWNLLYLHLAEAGRVPLGTYLRAGDRVGHPSCEGAHATGTHLHIARKFNGEWIPATGYLPFALSGWVVEAGEKSYEGTLTRDGQVVIANPFGPDVTLIMRGE